MFQARTKYIEIDYHFVGEQVTAKQLDIQFINSGDQIADGFTKMLLTWKLHEFRNNLNLTAELLLTGDVNKCLRTALCCVK